MPSTTHHPASDPVSTTATNRRRAMRLTLLAVPALALCALTGCGPNASAGTTNAGPTNTGPTNAAASASAGAPAGSATSATSAAATERTVTSAKFEAPSHNMYCDISADAATCVIVQKQWQAPTKPAACSAEIWGTQFTVGDRDKGEMQCSGQILVHDDTDGIYKNPTLDYGSALRTKNIRCSMDQAVLRCENLTTKHGFILAQERYTLF